MIAASIASLLLLSAAPAGACIEVAVERAGGTWGLGPAWHLPADRCAGAVAAGPLTLRAVGPGGKVLASAPVATAPVADGALGDAGGTGRLALDGPALGRLRALELREGGKLLARRRPSGTGGPDRANARRRGGNVVVRWDDRAWPFALVRDATTGTVLTSAARGRALVRSQAERVELLLSDGVRGRRVVLPVR